MESFHSHGVKVGGSAAICRQHLVALEMSIYLLLVIILALPACTVKLTGLKSTVSGKVFALLNVNAIDLLSLIKLSDCFSLHDLDKKITILPRFSQKASTSSLFYLVQVCRCCAAQFVILSCLLKLKAALQHGSKFLSCLPSRWQTLLNFGTGKSCSSCCWLLRFLICSATSVCIFESARHKKSKSQQQ